MLLEILLVTRFVGLCLCEQAAQQYPYAWTFACPIFMVKWGYCGGYTLKCPGQHCQTTSQSIVVVFPFAFSDVTFRRDFQSLGKYTWQNNNNKNNNSNTSISKIDSQLLFAVGHREVAIYRGWPGRGLKKNEIHNINRNWTMHERSEWLRKSGNHNMSVFVYFLSSIHCNTKEQLT